MRATKHADLAVDGDPVEFAEASLLQGYTHWYGATAADGEFPGDPATTVVYNEIRRSVYWLGFIYASYSLYCLWHELSPRKRRGEVWSSSWKVPHGEPLQACHAVRFVTTFFVVAGHLADALGYIHPVGQELHSWGNAFVIPAFSFASGVFNAGATSTVVYSTWSCAAVALVLAMTAHVFVASAVAAGPVSGADVLAHRMRYYWFLPCLVVWRLTLLPLAKLVARENGGGSIVARAVAFATGISIACYAGRHFWMPTYEPSSTVFIWNRLFAFGPFFAAGALIPMQGWQGLLSDWRLQALGGLYFGIWHLLLVALPAFRQMNVTACYDPRSCEFHDMGGHFPIAALYRPYSASGFAMDLSVYTSMLLVTAATVWLISGALTCATPKMPAVVDTCTSCGAHTLFALVLHVPLIEIAKMTQVQIIAFEVPEWLRTPFLVVLTAQVVAVLTCDATVTLLRTLKGLFCLLAAQATAWFRGSAPVQR